MGAMSEDNVHEVVEERVNGTATEERVQGNGDNYGPSVRIARSGLTFAATGRKFGVGIWPTYSQRE